MKKKIYSKLKSIRVNHSGCLDKYESGLLMVYYPQGVWYDYKNKTVKEEIINVRQVKGKIVKRLLFRS